MRYSTILTLTLLNPSILQMVKEVLKMEKMSNTRTILKIGMIVMIAMILKYLFLKEPVSIYKNERVKVETKLKIF